MRIFFMGTPQLAVPVLKRIIESQHDVALVVTQPDKPVGRHRHMAPPPVKALALEEGITVLQPATLKDEGFQAQIRLLDADIGIVFAYGKIIPQWLLDLPKHGIINIHVSLLPRWRGAAPIQRAIMAGDEVMGVTIMQMAAGLDTGDILLQRAIPIDPDDTAGSITDKMTEIGAALLIDALCEIENGTVAPQEQDESQVTYAEKITERDLEIDWLKPAQAIVNQVRGLNPKPGAFTCAAGKHLKVWRAKPETTVADGEPGTIIGIDKHRGPFVVTGEGALLLEEVQPENKKKMTGAEFIRGHRLSVGDKLGCQKTPGN